MSGSKESPELPPVVVERRKGTARRKTILGALVISRDGARVIDCMVRDLSDTGAKIRIVAGQAILPRHYLVVSKQPVAYDASIVWSKGSEVGVRFHATLKLEDLDRPEYNFLRRLVMQRMSL